MVKTQTQEVPVITLLEDIEEITVTPTRFVGLDFFAGWDVGPNAHRKLRGLTVETDGKPVKVKIRRLRKSSPDGPIINELGDFPKALVPLPVWAAIAVTGRLFVGYLRDSDGILWAVGCGQFGDYRYVEVYSVEESGADWDYDCRFASLANS